MSLTLSTPKTPYQLEVINTDDHTVLRNGHILLDAPLNIQAIQQAIKTYGETNDITRAFGQFPVYVVEFILEGLYDGKGSLTYELTPEPIPA
jgi:hypothetical protein